MYNTYMYNTYVYIRIKNVGVYIYIYAFTYIHIHICIALALNPESALQSVEVLLPELRHCHRRHLGGRLQTGRASADVHPTRTGPHVPPGDSGGGFRNFRSQWEKFQFDSMDIHQRRRMYKQMYISICVHIYVCVCICMLIYRRI